MYIICIYIQHISSYTLICPGWFYRCYCSFPRDRLMTSGAGIHHSAERGPLKLDGHSLNGIRKNPFTRNPIQNPTYMYIYIYYVYIYIKSLYIESIYRVYIYIYVIDNIP